jgi:hypothetical protein
MWRFYYEYKLVCVIAVVDHVLKDEGLDRADYRHNARLVYA